MKRVLIVAYYFPPVAASGAMRPLAFCRFLESYGWRPRVVTTDAQSVFPPHPVDPQLAGKLPAAVRVDAVPHGNPLQRLLAWREQVRSFLGSHQKGRRVEGLPPERVAHPASPAAPGSSLKRLVLDWTFEFPDPQCSWLGPVTSYAKAFSREEIPDVIWATGGPWTSLLVGKELATHWGVPLIVDYRDPWTSNPYVSFSSDWLNGRARKLEESVLNRASRIVTNTHELRSRLQQDYPAVAAKCSTITNGFDPEAFPHLSQRSAAGVQDGGPINKAPLELCHFGTVYGKRTPIVLLQAVLDLYRAGRLSNAHLSLRFVGAWEVAEASCEDVAQQLEKAGLLKREPPIPYQACLRQMTAADALLVIQPDSPLQIPGKIYEYIATGRPLVLLGGEGATANLVNRHRLGLACSNGANDIRQLLYDIVDHRRTLAPPAPAEVARFDYRSLTGDLAKVLDEVVRAGA